DKNLEEIVVVRDFSEVFLDDLSGLPPIWEIEFRTELIHGAVPVVKFPYCLAPSKLEELSGQLKELQQKDCRGVPRNVNPVDARNPPIRACSECSSTDHVRSACPRWNRAQRPGGNRPNQVFLDDLSGLPPIWETEFRTELIHGAVPVVKFPYRLAPSKLEELSGQLKELQQKGCSYKKFLACNPKEYDGKGGVVVLTRWIEKIKNVQDMSGCSIDQKVKYTAGSFVDSWDVAATEPKTMQKALQIFGALTYKAVRNRSIKKVEKRGNAGEPSKDKNGRDDNKRTRTGNAFATIANPIRRENTGAWPKLCHL
nr:reverse transcriptase domain-containing protein [Tanacetum cinerariifolium]